MFKILLAVAAMFFLESEPVFEPVPIADVSADFDVIPDLLEISADVNLIACDEIQPVDCATHERFFHAVVPMLTLSTQSDVMPDFALSGGDGRPI